jgi:hypothetical protein
LRRLEQAGAAQQHQDAEYDDAADRQQRAHGTGRLQAHAVSNRQSAAPGASGIGAVEGGVVQRGGHSLGIAGHIHQSRLHCRADRNAAADGKQVEGHGPDVGARVVKRRQRRRIPDQRAEDGPQARAVGKPAAHQIPDRHADTHHGQQHRQRGRRTLVTSSKVA